MNHKYIQLTVLALAALSISVAGMMFLTAQVEASSNNISAAIRLNGAAQAPLAPNVVCSNGDYSITQTTGASVVAGTTDIGNHTDDGVTNITLPFSYTLYDQAYTTVNVSSNGNLQFATFDTQPANSCLPYNFAGFVGIYPYWDDLIT